MEYAIYFIAYLIGSIPFGLVLTKLFGLGDIRKTGSGNIGATNVLRTGNKALALLTLLLDGGKGAIMVIAAIYLHTSPPEIFVHSYEFYTAVGAFAICGHCFPVWLKFKGGKGVATTLGTLLAAVPMAGVVSCATWLAVALLFKISSLAALLAVAIAPIVTFFLYGYKAAGVCLLITILVWIRHKDNIRRLIQNQEPKIGENK